MGFLSSLFGGSSAPTPEIAREMDLGRYFYLLDYRQVYADFLSTSPNPSLVIAELFLFRGWVTQFGFRIFSSRPDISERIIYEVVNLSSTLGRASLTMLHGVQFERIFPTDFMSVLESRWQEYDSIFMESHTQDQPFAPFPICGALSTHCGPKDPIKSILLAKEYLLQINEIKEEAIRRRILSQ